MADRGNKVFNGKTSGVARSHSDPVSRDRSLDAAQRILRRNEGKGTAGQQHLEKALIKGAPKSTLKRQLQRNQSEFDRQPSINV